MVQSHFYFFFQNKIFFFFEKTPFFGPFFLIAHGARPPVVTTDSYLTPPRSARLSRISLARLYAAPRLASHCAIPLTTARHQADTSTAHWWTFVMHNAHTSQLPIGGRSSCTMRMYVSQSFVSTILLSWPYCLMIACEFYASLSCFGLRYNFLWLRFYVKSNIKTTKTKISHKPS